MDEEREQGEMIKKEIKKCFPNDEDIIVFSTNYSPVEEVNSQEGEKTVIGLIEEENLKELLAKDYFDTGKKLTGTEKALMKKQLVWLIESMRYEKSPGKTINGLGEIIVQMIIASNKFSKKGKEARELYGE